MVRGCLYIVFAGLQVQGVRGVNGEYLCIVLRVINVVIMAGCSVISGDNGAVMSQSDHCQTIVQVSTGHNIR